MQPYPDADYSIHLLFPSPLQSYSNSHQKPTTNKWEMSHELQKCALCFAPSFDATPEIKTLFLKSEYA